MDCFKEQIQLDLNTGMTKRVPSSTISSARRYFEALNQLNYYAYIYGVVYLATPEALKHLDDLK